MINPSRLRHAVRTEKTCESRSPEGLTPWLRTTTGYTPMHVPNQARQQAQGEIAKRWAQSGGMPIRLCRFCTEARTECRQDAENGFKLRIAIAAQGLVQAFPR